MGNATETVNIKPLPQRIDTMIAFYQNLNDVGKASFILTIQKEDRRTVPQRL